jgi:lysophospholipase L1-like esterase
MRSGFVTKSHFVFSSRKPANLQLESLEARFVLSTSYLLEPVVPAIDSLMQANLQSVYRLGQQLGNRSDVFMKVGDSNSYSGNYLDSLGGLAAAFASGWSLGSYAPLASTLGFFSLQAVDGTGANAFNHTSVATFGGWTSTDLLTPGKRGAAPGAPQFAFASPLVDEVQELRPAMALVMIGTNDVITLSPSQYHTNLTLIVQCLASEGVIPILSSIPSIDLPGDPSLPGRLEQFNQIIADVASANEVPFLNLKPALDPLPFNGLGPDLVHLSVSPNGSGASALQDMAYGMNMRNLVSVEALDKVLRVVMQNAPADVTSNPISVAERAPLIDSLYQRILDRGSDPAGLAEFSQQLNQGVAVEEIVAELWTSTEHRALQIDQFYEQFLHRRADPDGTQYWLQAFASGAEELAIKTALADSDEYRNAHPTPEQFVAGLYQDGLHRDPGSSETTAWLTQAQAGLNSGRIVQQILLSQEAQGAVVNQYYVQFLDRPADPAGGQLALGLLRAPIAGDLALVQTLLSSAEFVASLKAG